MPLDVTTNARRRLVFLFSIPVVFSVFFFLVDLAAERTGIHLLEIQNLQSNVTELRRLALEAESGERGYLLTGDDRYLLPLKQGEALLGTQIKFCEESAKDRPELRPEIKKIAALTSARFEQASNVLAAQQKEGFAQAIQLSQKDEDQTMIELKRQVAAVVGILTNAQRGYLDRQRTINRSTFVFFSVGTLIMIAVMVWLYDAFLNYIYARDLAREQLEKTNAGLQAHVEERTRELREMNAEHQQFAYVVSHDLQEPLRTITSFSQLLVSRYRGKLDGDADEFAGYIITASRRMTDLVNGLLQMVQLRKTAQPIAPVSFEKLLADAEASLQAAIRETEARIEHGPLPILVVDQVQFSQVLQNFLPNLVKCLTVVYSNSAE